MFLSSQKEIPNAALVKIGGVYASFKPQHDDIHKKLGTVLPLSQIESVEDLKPEL